MIDGSDHHARRLVMEGRAHCSHRYKKSQGIFDYCLDCGKQLFRMAIPRRTGKTAKRKERER